MPFGYHGLEHNTHFDSHHHDTTHHDAGHHNIQHPHDSSHGCFEPHNLENHHIQPTHAHQTLFGESSHAQPHQSLFGESSHAQPHQSLFGGSAKAQPHQSLFVKPGINPHDNSLHCQGTMTGGGGQNGHSVSVGVECSKGHIFVGGDITHTGPIHGGQTSGGITGGIRF